MLLVAIYMLFGFLHGTQEKVGDIQVVVENAAEALANLIMNLVRVIDPDTVVLGGGIVADGYMHEKILEKLHPTTMRFVSNGVVITKLNPGFIGLLGAGAVAMNM